MEVKDVPPEVFALANFYKTVVRPKVEAQYVKEHGRTLGFCVLDKEGNEKPFSQIENGSERGNGIKQNANNK